MVNLENGRGKQYEHQMRLRYANVRRYSSVVDSRAEYLGMNDNAMMRSGSLSAKLSATTSLTFLTIERARRYGGFGLT